MINFYREKQATAVASGSSGHSHIQNVANVSDFTGTNTDTDSGFHKTFRLFIAGFGLLLLAMVIHIINWDRHSFTVIPLKFTHAIGIAGPQSLRELARICEERMKYDCTESVMLELLKSEPNTEEFVKLGNLQRKINHFQPALHSYTSAKDWASKENINNDTLWSDIYYGLAKTYESIGQSDLAMENYASAIKAKPRVIQLTVTESYLRLLRSLGRDSELKAVVSEARKRSGSQSLFAEFL